MTYYAIKRKKDGKLVSGSNFSYYPPRCIISDEYATPLLLTEIRLESELYRRKINLKYYEVVKVEVIEVSG